MSSASWAALAPVRSTGTCPIPRKNCFLIQPFRPFSVKYSDFARKVTRRLMCSGRKNESATARWLETRMAPPVSGTWAVPEIVVGKNSRSKGPISTYFITA